MKFSLPDMGKKTDSITFRPDEDIAKTLGEVLEELGNPRGLRTQLINDALRAELDTALEKYFAKQQAAKDVLQKRLSRGRKEGKT